MHRIFFALLFLSLTGVISAQDVDTGRLERSEMRFLEGMSDHHQMALDMANDCIAKAKTPAVIALCQAVIDAQTPEIDQMRVWLLDWYNIEYAVIAMVGPEADDSHTGHGAMAMPDTDPAMMMGMFAGFNRLEGVDYEIAWLESMIDHHDDALHMSRRLLARGTVHDDLAALAQVIIDAQTAEIEYMETLLAELAL